MGKCCAYRHEAFAGHTAATAYGYVGLEREDRADRQCWMDAEAGTDRCLLHTEDASRGEAQGERLKQLVTAWNDANRSRPDQNKLALVLPGMRCGAVNLSSVIFSGTVCFDGATFNERASFEGAQFSGVARFDRATFGGKARFVGAAFSREARFDRATFGGKARFVGATFSRETRFVGATFSGVANFAGATFSGGTHFNEVTFSRAASFDGATFSEWAVFDGATFGREGVFDGATFGKRVTFAEATFSGAASFDGATFNAQCRFEQAKVHILKLWDNTFKFPPRFADCRIHQLQYTTHLGERIQFNGCRIAKWSEVLPYGESLPPGTKDPEGAWPFTQQDCSRLTFENMDLSRANFMGADVSDTHFISCRWDSCDKRPYGAVFRHPELLASAKQSGQVEQFHNLEALCQQLKHNLESHGEWAAAGDFHYREMEVRKLRQETTEDLSIPRGLLELYRWVADFGENYIRLFIMMVSSVLLTICGVTYVEKLWGNGAVEGWVSLFWANAKLVPRALIPSAFQRFDRAPPLHWLSTALIIAEGLALLVLTTLFVMAIRRRFRR